MADKKPTVAELQKLLKQKDIHIQTLEQNVANQAVTLARLETNLKLMDGQRTKTDS